MIREILAIAAAPSTADFFVRLLLLARSSGGRIACDEAPRTWLAVIPARNEGKHVLRTIESVVRNANRERVRTVLLLDGDDTEAREAASNAGAEVFVKEPAGPTKAAALAWLAAKHGDVLAEVDAVLILDVGSRLSDRFFETFRWPAGSDGGQTWLRGTGEGVGDAAAQSERLAQEREDRGRQALGWSVRLRGTGTVLRPRWFSELMPILNTQVEDLEASLAAAARGARLTMSCEEAFVVDEKPRDVASAAGQRARWLAGRVQLLLKKPGDFARLTARHPGEGLAFFLEIFGRPLSLSLLLRAIAGSIIAALSIGSPAWMSVGLAIATTAIFDILLLFVDGRLSMKSGGRMFAAWIGAVILAPRALFRWMRAKRS